MLPGLLVDGVDMLGAEEMAVYLHVQVPTPKPMDGLPAIHRPPPAVSLHRVLLYIVIRLLMPSANNSVENDVGVCVHYGCECSHWVQC